MKKIIFENKIEEKLTRIQNYFIAYHRTADEKVQKIADDGFTPGGGAMYGEGWYFCYDLASQVRRDMTHYGNAIIKAKINPKNLLIFDYNVSKDLFGDKYTLADQLITHYKIYRDILDIPRDLFVWSKELEETFNNPSFSAEIAYNKFVNKYISKGKCSIKEIRGIIFTGNHDGNVLVVYSYETAIPFEYALTDSTTGEMTTEWLSIKNVDKVIGRALVAEKALEKFRGMVKRIEVDNYDLSKIEKDFNWLFDAKFDKAIFKINDNKTFDWIDGVWLRGRWRGDHWFNGTFKSGVWEKGEFLKGRWIFGNFLNGVFDRGEWEDGVWNLGAKWTGQGSWRKGEIQIDKNKKIMSTQSPLEFASMTEDIVDLFRNKKLNEEFSYGSLSKDDQEALFLNFQKSYQKAVGVSWDKSRFESRAYDWTFFGDSNGGIALRVQKSKMYKLTATFGSPKSIINAYKEMMSSIGKEPVWGVMTLSLAEMLEKLSNKEFKIPPKLFTKTVIPHISHLFGDTIKSIANDGGMLIDTPAGTMTKYFIANKAYYKRLLDDAKNHSDKLPIPKPVLTVLIGILKMII